MKGVHQKFTVSSIYERYQLKKWTNIKPKAWSEVMERTVVEALANGVPTPKIFIETFLDEHNRTMYKVLTREDFLEGIIAFIEKRLPNEEEGIKYFEGREQLRNFWMAEIDVFLVNKESNDMYQLIRMFPTF